MSFQAMSWAVMQTLPSASKIVLLMLANRVNSDTGRCTPRIRLLAEDCGLSESSVKRALSALQESGLIEIHNRFEDGIQKPNQYELLMGGVGSHRPGGGFTVNPGVGSHRPTESGSSEPVINQGFERFWKAWPSTDRKVDKKGCLRRWMKAGLDAESERIIADVIRRKGTKSWLEGFEPAPATYLNQRRWETEEVAEMVDQYGIPL